MEKKVKKIIQVNEFGYTIRMYDELLALFENACECLYYGEGKSSWFTEAESCMSHEDAVKLWKAAFTLMGEETQPDLELLKDITLR